MNWFSGLPPELQTRAYIHGDEAAWSREDALEVIHVLSTLGKVVLGVEVWLRTGGAPRIPSPHIYQWDSGHLNATDHEQSAVDINAAGLDYVKGFQWDSRDVGALTQQPYFNLTVS
jgi:hypothetical protein